MASLTVNVTANTAPTLTYGDVSVTANGSTTNSPSAASDNGAVTGYESSTPSEEVMLTADINDDFAFETSSQTLRASIPAGLRVNTVYRGQMDPATAKAHLSGPTHPQLSGGTYSLNPAKGA
jgi:hypothetical protein